MITEITIEGYRGFGQRVAIRLSPITLLVGDNATGKTSVLEALQIWRWGGHPYFFWQPPLMRRLPQSAPPNHLESWLALFHATSADGSKPCFSIQVTEMSARSTGSEERPAGICVELADDLNIIPPDSLPRNASGTVSFIQPSGFTHPMGVRTWRIDSGGSKVPPPRFVGGYQQQGFLVHGPAWSNQPSDLVSARDQDALALVQTWSDVERTGQGQDVLSAIRKVIPEVADFRVLHLGGIPRLHAVPQSEPTRRLPLESLGEGISRMVEMMFKVAMRREGLLLVDEIDFGIHHSRLSCFFRAIFDLAGQTRCQLVATTHSAEALNAAVEAASQVDTVQGSPGFSLVRLERDTSGRIHALDITAEQAAAAVEFGVELRGNPRPPDEITPGV